MFRAEGGQENRELWESKLVMLLAATGYVAGLGNVWCFCTGHRRVEVVNVRRVATGWPVQRPSRAKEFKGAK